MVKLRSQLLVHRHRVGQSSLSTALRHGSHASADVVQFRPSLSRFPASPVDRVDGGEQAFAQPVAFYAAVFFFVNVTYILLIWELIEPRADLASKVAGTCAIARSQLCAFSESPRWSP